MDRRTFSKKALALGLGWTTGTATGSLPAADPGSDVFEEAARRLPVRKFDVVVAGAGTAGVVAAIASARQGARTAVIEWKGYPGGTVVEGGTALHSFYNLWKA
ncbi:MAG: FAD-dependent oxidoreductase, partial [Planctomycetota bacterium]